MTSTLDPDPFLDIKDLRTLRSFPTSMETDELANDYGQLTEPGIKHILELCGALWIHSGDSNAPHAELTSGKCSDGFVDVLRALQYTNVSDLLAYCLFRAIEKK